MAGNEQARVSDWVPHPSPKAKGGGRSRDATAPCVSSVVGAPNRCPTLAAQGRGTRTRAGLVLLLAVNLPLAVAGPIAVTGSLNVEQGVRVLRVWGSPYEQGFAHGYLLAENIVGFLEGVLLDPHVMPDPRIYESRIRQGLLRRMHFASVWRDELVGMLAGIREKLGPDGAVLKRLRRPLDIDDLKALNTLADWNPSGCTSFAAWGRATSDGTMIVARNLDYIDLPGITGEHLIVAYIEPQAGCKRFVAIGWPGLIGVYTAMNEDGVVVAVHDAPASRAMDAERLTPRSLTLREIVERATPDDAVDLATRIVRKRRSFRGNNFLVAAPLSGQRVPAVVFEYDGNIDIDGGATLRTPEDKNNLSPPDTVVCTNHYRTRAKPIRCNRYDTVRSGLAEKIDGGEAFELIKKAARSGTIHTLIALPARKEFIVRFASPGRNATQNPPARFLLDDLWNRK